jgi:hypothetical protein
MSRRTERIVIEDDNRDKGKEFLITELSSYEAEQWVWQLLPVLAASGIEVNDDTLKGGFASIMALGAASILRMPYGFVKSLLDQMLPCIKYQHYDTQGHAVPPVPIAMNAQCQVEELSTWFKLRKAVLDLHIHPLSAAAKSKDSEPHPRHPAASLNA